MGGCDKEEEEISYITQSTIKEDERNLWCPKVKPSVSRVIIQRMLHTEQLATRLSVIKKQINQVIRIFKFDTIYFMLKCQSDNGKKNGAKKKKKMKTEDVVLVLSVNVRRKSQQHNYYGWKHKAGDPQITLSKCFTF